MPEHAIRRRLVPPSFHRELVERMKAAGFVQMYQFHATTDRDVYHVPAQYAQETTHFFYMSERGFLVKLALAEHIDEQGEYRSWWSGGVYLELDRREMITFEVLHLCSQHDSWDCAPLEHLMDNLDELLAPFQCRGGNRMHDSVDGEADSFGWKFDCSGALTIDQLVAYCDGLRTHFGPFLKPTLSHDFSVFTFTNRYAWPKIDERFWRGFPTRLLKALVPGRIRDRVSC